MKQQIKRISIPVLAISLFLVACNQSDSKTEEPKPADTTAAAPAEVKPVEPAVADAVAAAPNFYKVVADTMGIRMLEVTYNPGDSSAWHSHPDYVIYVAQGGSATFYGKDGKSEMHEMKTGATMVKGAEMHSVKNTGKAPIKVILFEVNRPMGSMAHDAATDASKVAAGLYKVAADSLGIRVLEINYKPGQSSAMHSHPDNALYVISDGKAEFTDKDGKKNTMELKKGMTSIRPAESHSVKNVGTTTMKAILVEVSRPMK